MRSPVRAAWSLAGTSAPAHHASGSSQTFRASAPGLTRCAGCALHHLSSPSPSPSHQPQPQSQPPAVALAVALSLSLASASCRYAPHYSVLEEINKPDGSKHFMKRCAASQCRGHSRRAAPYPHSAPASPPARPPASPPARPPASQPGGNNGLPLCLSRYIVAQCREDDPAPCPRVATPAAPLHHPEIAQYFAGFDPQRGYLPTSELAALYPDG